MMRNAVPVKSEARDAILICHHLLIGVSRFSSFSWHEYGKKYKEKRDFSLFL